MKLPELLQPVEKKGKCVRSIARIICRAQRSIGSTQTTNRNENNMLDHRFSVAPMMDWTGASQKAKYNQRFDAVVGRHAVPNAVRSRSEVKAGERCRDLVYIGSLASTAAYYAGLRYPAFQAQACSSANAACSTPHRRYFPDIAFLLTFALPCIEQHQKT